MIPSALALPEQDGHTLGHVNSQESVEVPYDGRDDSKCDSFGDSVLREMFSSKFGDLQVELDDEGSIQTLLTTISHIMQAGYRTNRKTAKRAYPKDSEDDEEYNLEEMPIPIVSDLEQYQLSCSERVHCLEK